MATDTGAVAHEVAQYQAAEVTEADVEEHGHELLSSAGFAGVHQEGEEHAPHETIEVDGPSPGLVSVQNLN